MSWQGGFHESVSLLSYQSDWALQRMLIKGMPPQLDRMSPSRSHGLSDISTSLVGTGNIDKAAIFNSEGNSVWASSPGFTVCLHHLNHCHTVGGLARAQLSR